MAQAVEDPVRNAQKVLKDNRNDGYRQALADQVNANRRRFRWLSWQLTWTYILLVLMLVTMFVIGIILLFRGGTDVVQGEDVTGGLTSLGAGGLDLLLLGLARPIERIRAVKNDRVQMFVLLSDYQIQTTTALLWYNKDKRDTIIQAADRIRDLTLETVELIETHMGGQDASPVRLQQGMLNRIADENARLTDRLTRSLVPEAAKDPVRTVRDTLRRSPRGIPDI